MSDGLRFDRLPVTFFLRWRQFQQRINKQMRDATVVSFRANDTPTQPAQGSQAVTPDVLDSNGKKAFNSHADAKSAATHLESAEKLFEVFQINVDEALREFMLTLEPDASFEKMLKITEKEVVTTWLEFQQSGFFILLVLEHDYFKFARRNEKNWWRPVHPSEEEPDFVLKIRLASFYDRQREQPGRKGKARKILCIILSKLVECNILSNEDSMYVQPDASTNDDLVKKVYNPLGFSDEFWTEQI